MPELPDVVPMVGYEDCAAAADWLAEAFGFEEVDRLGRDGAVTHVTMRCGSAYVFLGTPGASYVNPKRLREECEVAARMYGVPWVVDGVYVQVDDLEGHRERAVRAGATVLSEERGERRLYRAEDPEGHRWMFAQR
jgi:uncharacterized glyoxalase superfamily protein PhnB